MAYLEQRRERELERERERERERELEAEEAGEKRVRPALSTVLHGVVSVADEVAWSSSADGAGFCKLLLPTCKFPLRLQGEKK